ncbi:virB8 type IV secretion protein, partial [Helicobacter pylori]
MSNLQELREHLKELENSFEIGSFTKENIKEYAKCFFMSLSMFLEEQEKNQ